jgi:hypothetical protein
MSSRQLHTEQSQLRQGEIAAESVHAKHSPERRDARTRRQRGPAFRGRRLAIAVAAAVGVASGSAAIATVASHTQDASTPGLRAGTSAPALRVGETSSSFVSRIRALEARGYMDITCQVGGDLMFNPRTHRYETVRA